MAKRKLKPRADRIKIKSDPSFVCESIGPNTFHVKMKVDLRVAEDLVDLVNSEIIGKGSGGLKGE